MKKLRIVEEFYREGSTAEVKSQFFIQELRQHEGFFGKKWEEWEWAGETRYVYDGRTYTSRYKLSTLKEAKKLCKNLLKEVPEQVIHKVN